MFETRRTPLFLAALALTISVSPRPTLAQGFKVIHENTQDDASPHTLIQNPGDGLLYGTCQSGGTHYPHGCVFKMDTSGTVTVLYSFSGAPTDGSHPSAALFLNDDGMLYGDTANGGTNDTGGVFKLDTSGGSYAFAEQPICGVGPTGANPQASFFKANDGNLYVPVMTCGPPNKNGVIDRVDTSLAENEIAAFDYLTGVFDDPQGHLLQGSDSMLYGCALAAPNNGNNLGGVYRIPLGGGEVQTVHAFALGEGTNPVAPLLLASDGNFWGTTLYATKPQGGGLSTGSIFKVGEDGTFQTMHMFQGPDGLLPAAGLMQKSDGYLYGVTASGGKNGIGVIFRIDLSGNYKLLANILDTYIGQNPSNELLEGSDQKLYGTTGATSGQFGFGTIYTIDFTQNVTDIVPNSGDYAGGTAVTIHGTGFVDGAAVQFGGPQNNATNVTVVGTTQINANTPPGPAGTLTVVQVILPDQTVILLNDGFFYDYLDVPANDIFEPYIRKLLGNGVTAGCGGGNYCRDAPVLRKQMAVFALKAKNGPYYVPPPAVGIFTDVPASDPFAPWIEALYNLNVVAGCGAGPTYCPDSPVLRQQMPVFLLKALLGSGYTPPACVGLFLDVPCPSLFAPWIEDVVNRKIAAGCGNQNFCPGNPTTRGQMAPFLVKTFQLP